jgi:hypothetical protein
MVVRLRVASPLTRLRLAKWIAAWRAACSQVESASKEAQAEPEAEAHAVKAWKSIDQLS